MNLQRASKVMVEPTSREKENLQRASKVMVEPISRGKEYLQQLRR
jgi:hypothetical protein